MSCKTLTGAQKLGTIICWSEAAEIACSICRKLFIGERGRYVAIRSSQKRISMQLKSQLAGEDVFTVNQLLSDTDCFALIDLAEAIGFEAATVNTAAGHQMLPDWRNNTRVVLDDTERASWLWQRARDFIPQVIDDSIAVGVNERLRFYRYDPGQKFDWHTDGFFRRDSGDRSRLTFMVYLNGGFTGGETSFSDNAPTPRFADFSVTPDTGLALFFKHMLLHKGQPVTEGRKYVLRTDVMYSQRADAT